MDYLSPIEALFPGVGGAVLAVLVDTGEPLTIRQIAQRADAAHPQVAHHVERLEGLGVVQRRVAGRSHLVSLTESAPADLLRGLAQLRDRVLARMRVLAEDIEPPPRGIIVFGSFARGTARAGSDLDVAIVAPPGRADDDLWLASVASWVDRVAEYAGNPVAEIVVSVDELPERVGDPPWDRIRQEGVVVIGPSVDDLLSAPRGATGPG